MPEKILVIGSGFSGLASAAYLSKNHVVEIVEKNHQIGGRARILENNGFVFDMGPSWYWMPDIFEKFFNDFGYSVSDFYLLKRLNPSFQIIYPDETMAVPDDTTELYKMFEKYEKGAGEKLLHYLNEMNHIYSVAVDKMLYKPYLSFAEYFTKDVLDASLLKSLFYSVSHSVRRYFKHPKIIQLLEFPVIFLGATAKNIPALYGLMNYAAFQLGTWYPMGGMFQIIKAIEKICIQNNVSIHTNTNVHKIIVKNNKAIGVETSQGFISADIILSSADYAFTENQLLEKKYRNYDEDYWNKKTFAPSALIFYLGINKKLPKLLHHNLFFDADFDAHIKTVYETFEWTNDPLFYLSVPSKTDASVAPEDCENLFILIPVAIGLKDNPQIHQQLFDKIIDRIEKFTGTSFKNNIVVKHTYSVQNFMSDYNSYKGNAYGLANTLFQTATFKPKLKNKKVSNLYYTGQLTVPGPGVPPSLISGKLVAQLINKQLKKQLYETSV